MISFKQFLIEQVSDFEAFKKRKERESKAMLTAKKSQQQEDDFYNHLGDLEKRNEDLYNQYLKKDVEYIKRYKVFGFGSINDVIDFVNTDPSMSDVHVLRRIYNLAKDGKFVGLVTDIAMICQHLKRKTQGDFIGYMNDNHLLNDLISVHQLLVTAKERFDL